MKLLKNLTRVLLVVLSVFALFVILVPAGEVAPFEAGRVDVIAHQGGNLENPDATFEAFDAAVRAGSDVLEMDVHLSKDGHLIVMHDETVDRTTNGTGFIRDLTLAEIKNLDAAYWWPYHSNDDVDKNKVPANQVFPFRDKNLKVPTLSEMFKRYPEHRFTIELKDNTGELREALLEAVAQNNRWNRVLIASFYKETLQAIRASEPRAQTYGAESEIRLFYILHWLKLERLFPYSIDAFAVPMRSGGFNLATPRFVAAAKNSGISLHYWTINEETNMELLLTLGVDGVMTDRPALLVEMMQGR